jgi:micrococcal nuclease
VIDGDTFDSSVGRVRLFGVDTPERGEGCYREATERLGELACNSVRVEPGPREQDRSGRLLFYVYTENGESIGEKLIREGLAHAWTEDGQHRDFLVDLESQARKEGNGCLWQ